MDFVYLVMQGEYSDKHILYATLNRIAAEAFTRKFNERFGDSYDEVWILEQPLGLPNYLNENFYKMIYQFEFNEKNEFVGSYSFADCAATMHYDNYSTSLNTEEERNSFVKNGYFIEPLVNGSRTGWHRVYLPIDKEKDYWTYEETEKYNKIAKDYLMKYLAEKEGL